ncbi:hypothetical protein AeNC1_010769 [Aphanomyces euteiches]|nr:hypothetical protein AeNC1_010769 [Aphanomyces euteiches]
MKEPEMGLPRLIYSVDVNKIGDDLRSKFIPLDRDDETQEFLNSCFETGVYNMVASTLSTFLNMFYSVTDTNGMLDRGQMFVVSSANVSKLFKFPQGYSPAGKLLDIGAGDGNVTARLAPFVKTVYSTEVSIPMVRALNARDFQYVLTFLVGSRFHSSATHTTDLSHPDVVAQGPYDFISLLNVLDRADKPLTLLHQIHNLLSPNARQHTFAIASIDGELGSLVDCHRPAILGIVCNIHVVDLLSPCSVEVGTQKLPPTEELPMAGGLCAEGSSFEDGARIIAEKVFRPCGFEVDAFSRVPYLCRGGVSQPYYVLSDALFTLKKLQL